MIVAVRLSIPILAGALLLVPLPSAEQGTSPAPAKPDSRRVLVVFGDSISAGYGLSRDQSYPALLQAKFDQEKIPWRIVNQGVSGDTTAGGVARMQRAIERMPAAVLLELGGNDGLRGLPLTSTRDNLEKMIKMFQSIGAKVILAGMTLPPNYGPDYIKGFEQIYRDLAAKYKAPLIPFLLANIVTPDMRYFQPDGIHPNEDGSPIVADTVMKALRPILK
jgi:acyl-CoA thioesterase-1